MINLSQYKITADQLYKDVAVQHMLDKGKYEIDCFRPPNDKEIWIGIDGYFHNFQTHEPRLIVKKQQWIPKIGESFFYLDLYANNVIEQSVMRDFKDEWHILYKANTFFKTRVQAETALKQITESLKQITEYLKWNKNE